MSIFLFISCHSDKKPFISAKDRIIERCFKEYNRTGGVLVTGLPVPSRVPALKSSSFISLFFFHFPSSIPRLFNTLSTPRRRSPTCDVTFRFYFDTTSPFLCHRPARTSVRATIIHTSDLRLTITGFWHIHAASLS